MAVERTLPNKITAGSFKALRRLMAANNYRLNMDYIEYKITKLQDGKYEAYYDEPIWKSEEIKKEK